MLSVIVPVYCVSSDLLRKCIESILAQEYEDIELILVDDGSPDGSGEICDMYASRDKRVIVFHKENDGVSSARNLGIEKARGEHIAFVDADDYVGADYFSAMMSFFTDDCDMVVSGYTLDYGTYIEPMSTLTQCSLSRKEVVQWMLQEDYIRWGPVAKVYKRHLLQTVRFQTSLTMGEDLVFNLEILRKCDKAVYVPMLGYFYYQRLDSAVHEPFQAKHLSVITAMEYARREVLENYQELSPLMTDIYIKAFGSWCFRMLKNRNSFDVKAFAMLQGKLRPFFKMCLRRDFSFSFYIRAAVLVFMLPTLFFQFLKKIQGYLRIVD